MDRWIDRVGTPKNILVDGDREVLRDALGLWVSGMFRVCFGYVSGISFLGSGIRLTLEFGARACVGYVSGISSGFGYHGVKSLQSF